MTRKAVFHDTGAYDDGSPLTIAQFGVPDPSGQPDGKWLKTASGALIYTDPPTGATFGTPAIVLGTAAANGSTDEAIRRDSTIVAFDATVPTTQAFGDAAATGAAAVAARRDHKHAMPATPTTVSGNAGTATALQTSRNIDGQAFDGTADITVIAPGTHAATGKTTPVDADEMPLVDSAASNVLKKLTWANLKATLKTYFDTLYAPVSGGGSLTLISTVTLGADAASIAFSSISGYKHLILKASLRADRSAVSDTVVMQFNSDGTASHYESQRFEGNNSTASATAFHGVTITGIYAGVMTAGTSPSNSFAALSVDILDYLSTSHYKAALCEAFGFIDTANTDITRNGGLWKDTSAVTAITLVPLLSTNFKAGSTASLYGLAG